MLWVKAFHIIFMVTWFSGLFYLPRLFVYHAETNDEISNARFKIMERKLYFGITTPGAILTLIFGFWLLEFNMPFYSHQLWMHAKLALVALLVIYHLYLGKLLFDFRQDRNTHSHVFYRWLNEIPVLFLTGIIILVIVKPSV
jgi:putative membrane protein